MGFQGVRVTLVDRVGIAPAASGKAGGFLAKDWVVPALVPLAAASFSLHESLAMTLLGVDAVDYRRLGATNVTLRRPTKALRRSRGRRVPSEHPAWIDEPAGQWTPGAAWRSTAAMRSGSPTTCAQVHPAKLCNALMAAAGGVKLLVAAAVGLVMEEVDAPNGEGGGAAAAVTDPGAPSSSRSSPLPSRPPRTRRVRALRLEGGTELPVGTLVLALGPWSDRAAAWLPDAHLPAINGQQAHSVVLQDYGLGPRLDPEIYPRPHGEVYVYGAAEAAPKTLPDDPAEIVPSAAACDRLTAFARSVSSRLSAAAAPESIRQACCLPISPDGLPLIGRVPGTGGSVVMGAGHGVWGVLLGPATGLALSQLLLTGRSQVVDLSPFCPGRFANGGMEEGEAEAERAAKKVGKEDKMGEEGGEGEGKGRAPLPEKVAAR
ncbi:hypothetical protein MMPV_006482 [Pyropia vietnamensis]